MQKKILVVDDDKNILALLEKILSTRGYQVIKAQSGEEAADRIKINCPHLLITDIMMPDMYGSELAVMINDDPTIKNLPVIFISGLTSKNEEGIETTGINISERYYKIIGKPFSYEEILKEVEKALTTE